MEPFWSQAGATSGNQWQMLRAQKPRNQAKTVAVGCHRLAIGAHGKEDVCHRLPAVAVDPLLAKEGVISLAPQREMSPANPKARRTRIEI